MMVRRSLHRLALVCLAIALALSPLAAQEVPETSPFSEYEIIQYATTTDFAPRNLIEQDDNGELLLILRDPATREDLAARGHAISETTIMALRMMRLLEEDDDGVLRTSIPLLGPEETAALRLTVGAIAPDLAAFVRSEVERMLEQLDAIDRRRNAYTILFSYVVDGRVWDVFEAQRQVEPRKITVEKPYWGGEVWGVTPDRSGLASGTNTISDGGVALKVNWSHPAIPVMQGLMFDWEAQGRIVETLQEGGRVAPPPLREKLLEYGLADAAGRLTFPIVFEQSGDPLHDASLALAKKIANGAVDRLDLDALVAQFGFRDRSQALVVAYHELMWDLMTEWERNGLVAPPRLLADPASASHGDVGDVVFAVVSQQAQ